MRSEDPIVQAIYDALTLLPAAEIALADIARHERCDSRYQRLTDHLLGRIREQEVFDNKDCRDLEALLSGLRVWIDNGREHVWVHDEQCMSGGWYEVVVPSDLAVIEEHYVLLDKLLAALRMVRDVVRAHRLGYKMSV
nr:hypothetical protein [Paracoccus saliphilus]